MRGLRVKLELMPVYTPLPGIAVLLKGYFLMLLVLLNSSPVRKKHNTILRLPRHTETSPAFVFSAANNA
jgi:hypothetical protein